jgi:hypothetical protein
MLMFEKLILVFMTIFIVGCTNDDGPKPIDCSLRPCTQNFVTIFANVTDASGIAIPLDSFEVIDIDTGENLTLDSNAQEYENYRQQGTYPIFSDTYLVQYQNTNTTISFKGSISGNQVVNESFVVGADCCHVQLISGNTDIIID